MRTPFPGEWAPGCLARASSGSFPVQGSEAAGAHHAQGSPERCVLAHAAGTGGAQARLGDAALFCEGVAASPDATATGLVQPAPASSSRSLIRTCEASSESCDAQVRVEAPAAGSWRSTSVAGSGRWSLPRNAPGHADKRREDAPRSSRLALSIWASACCCAASRLSARAVDAPIAS